jgi:hypothetical protein
VPPSVISGAASFAMRTNEWQDTSIALAKPSAEQSSSPPWRSSFGAKAIEWTQAVELAPALANEIEHGLQLAGIRDVEGATIAASSASARGLDMGSRLVVQPGDGELGAGIPERPGAAIGDRILVRDFQR